MDTLTYEESRGLKNARYIDVRSPQEYEADHIPGALNLPLFDDAERVRIGEVYHQISQDQARLTGLEIVAPKLPGLVGSLAELSRQGQALVLYCWRGGLRSQAVATTARLMDVPCLRLRGGYRDYRRWVNGRLEEPVKFPLVMLHGLTGCGKTAVLRLLKEKHGLQTVDLEDLAAHRGSVFGHIGLPTQPTQKYFQSLLVRELCAYEPGRPLITECESRRIGRLLLPEQFFAAMRAASRLLLYDSLEGRIRRLMADYEPAGYTEPLTEALQSASLRKKFGAARLQELNSQAQAGDFEQVIAFLLTHYYDPLYHYPGQPDAGYAACFSTANEEEAAAEIAAYVAKL